MATSQLTAAERKTLNDAMDIIARCTPTGSSMLIDSARYDHSDKHYSGMTYFDTNEGGARGQHICRGETFADRIQAALDIEAVAATKAEEQRAKRREQLRAELAKLDEAA